jgi:hypothetical protein
VPDAAATPRAEREAATGEGEPDVREDDAESATEDEEEEAREAGEEAAAPRTAGGRGGAWWRGWGAPRAADVDAGEDVAEPGQARKKRRRSEKRARRRKRRSRDRRAEHSTSVLRGGVDRLARRLPPPMARLMTGGYMKASLAKLALVGLLSVALLVSRTTGVAHDRTGALSELPRPNRGSVARAPPVRARAAPRPFGR